MPPPPLPTGGPEASDGRSNGIDSWQGRCRTFGWRLGIPLLVSYRSEGRSNTLPMWYEDVPISDIEPTPSLVKKRTSYSIHIYILLTLDRAGHSAVYLPRPHMCCAASCGNLRSQQASVTSPNFKVKHFNFQNCMYPKSDLCTRREQCPVLLCLHRNVAIR